MHRVIGRSTLIVLLWTSVAIGAGATQPTADWQRRILIAQAQENFLRTYTSLRSSPERRDAECRSLVNKYVNQGMSADAFSPEAAKKAMLERVVHNLVASPRAHAAMVADARYLYGIDPAAIAAALPPAQEDLATLLKRAVQEKDPMRRGELLQKFSSAYCPPSTTKDIIKAAEEDGSLLAKHMLLQHLQEDWSDEGLRYVYDHIMQTQDPQEQKRLAEILQSRRQLDEDLHNACADHVTDEQALDALFEVANGLLVHDADEAKAFVLEQLRSPHLTNRTLAAKAIARNSLAFPTGKKNPVLVAIAEEPDPHVRAQLVGSMGRISSDPAVRKRLLEIISKDPDAEVKAAAVAVFSLIPPSSNPALARESRKDVEDLKHAVGVEPPGIVQDALKARLSRYEQDTQQREQSRQRHEEKIQSVMRSLAASTQTQPARR